MAYDLRTDNTAVAYTVCYPTPGYGNFPATIILTIDGEAAAEEGAIEITDGLTAFVMAGIPELPPIPEPEPDPDPDPDDGGGE